MLENIEADSIDYSVVIVDSNGLVYIHIFAPFAPSHGVPIFTSDKIPELVVKWN